MTRRTSKQDIYVYFSNIAASVLAVMGAFGFAMNFIEKKYNKYKKNRDVKRSLDYLENNRKQLAEKNFMILEDDLSLCKAQIYLNISLILRSSQFQLRI